MNKTARQSNFELLRIVSIFIIVIHHFALWTPWDFNSHGDFYRLTINFLMIGGKVGVNLFVMITAYFMINSNIKLKNIIRLIFEVTVFSIILYFISVIFHIGGARLYWQEVIESSLPIIFNRYWFMTAYFQLYLLIPLLNSGLNNLTKKSHFNLLIIFFFLFSIWPMIYIENGVTSSHLTWFIYLYALGSYFRKYEDKFNKTKMNYFIKLILVVFVTLLSTYSLIVLFSDVSNTGYYFLKEFLGWYVNIFVTREYGPFLLIISIYIFLIFKQLNLKENKYINKIASLTLGVYLFQSTPKISGWLWKDVFSAHLLSNGWQVLLYSLFVSSILFLIGIVLGFILSPVINILTTLTINIFNKKLIKNDKQLER
ncbi:acyltransferase [Vagococcus fluvialis]|uniref:acyltransferase n=1 Tax=Vagococcus fluvialis TaxID=2738 RepID=UPI001A8D4256|nr:acyltransferase family protein [Vagococcus fluvialis]MBO0487282.1 acyltransferase family protein [Vagococcus fluvialis]